MDFNAAALQTQFSIQRLKRFAYKLKVLQGGIGLQPQFRLHYINAAHRPTQSSLGQGRVVLPA
jgi:hypothetical protein